MKLFERLTKPLRNLSDPFNGKVYPFTKFFHPLSGKVYRFTKFFHPLNIKVYPFTKVYHPFNGNYKVCPFTKVFHPLKWLGLFVYKSLPSVQKQALAFAKNLPSVKRQTPSVISVHVITAFVRQFFSIELEEYRTSQANLIHY